MSEQERKREKGKQTNSQSRQTDRQNNAERQIGRGEGFRNYLKIRFDIGGQKVKMRALNVNWHLIIDRNVLQSQVIGAS